MTLGYRRCVDMIAIYIILHYTWRTFRALAVLILADLEKFSEDADHSATTGKWTCMLKKATKRQTVRWLSNAGSDEAVAVASALVAMARLREGQWRP